MKIFIPLFLLFFTVPLPAQEIAVLSTRHPESQPFAQPFSLEYKISHTPGYQVTVNEESLSGDFEISQMNSQQDSPGTLTYLFTVLPFSLGKSTFTVTFDLTQDGKTFSQAKEESFIDITPVKIFNDQKLREIRSPDFPSNLLAWLLAALLAAALGYVLHVWKKRIENPSLSVQKQQDSRPGHIIALSKIDALLNSGLWENQHYKLFYITLTDILREYLWKQLQIDASADTSAELLRRVKNLPEMAPLMYQLRDFLSSGDLVKFARVIPEETVRNKDVQLLREIILETSPKELKKQEEPV